MSITGSKVGVGVVDLATDLSALEEINVALYQREKTKQGFHYLKLILFNVTNDRFFRELCSASFILFY